MRGLEGSLTSLAMLLVLCAPAPAQSAPAASQYPSGSGECVATPDAACIQDLASGASAAAENTGQGAEAVNEALTGKASSASASAESGEDGKGPEEGLASITELPETGGAPIGTLGLGTLLVAAGLMARRVGGR